MRVSSTRAAAEETPGSSGAVNIAATGKVAVKGSGPMSIEASGMVELEGANVGIN